MREIKFRVWDKTKQNWVKYTDAELGSTIRGVNDNRYELMQFTGLKDKNGKEIYEGDIVQVEGAIPAEIYWKYEAWQLRNGDKTGGMLGNWEPEQIEVIGNIYENQDLLKYETI